MKLSTCSKHPGHRFAMSCPGCAQDCHDTQYGNPTNSGGEHSTRLADKVRAALGRYVTATVRPDEGETPIRRLVWSVRELDEIFARVGGVVAIQSVERTGSDSVYTVMEVTITMTLPGIAWPVQVFTDWDPADELHGIALPVIQAVTASV